MLFYNEQDQICFKEGDHFRIFYDHQRNHFELNGKWYTYTEGYFYDTDECDGDIEIHWDKRTHPRHMGIAEMDEAFASRKEDET